jgi:hypothetical protein
MDDIIIKGDNNTVEIASDSDSSESTSSSSSSTSDYTEKADMLSQFMDHAFADGEFSDNEVAGMSAILSGDTSSEGSDEPASSDLTATDFMEQVNDIAQQSDPGIGPGERMMLDEANRLVEGGGSSEDMQTFLDNANEMLNNADGNGDGPQDIDETNDGEGTMLRNLTTGLLADDDSSTDETGSSDDADSSDGNSPVSQFIDEAFADGSFSDNELAGLQALLGTDTEETDSSESTADSGSSEDAGATEANALISQFINQAYADGSLSDNDLTGLQALLGSIAESDPANATA